MESEGFQRILAAVDFSEHSAAALGFAAALRACGNARLAALFADSFLPPPYFTAAQTDQFKRQWSEWKQGADAALRRFLADTLGDKSGDIETLLVEMSPAEAILHTASLWRADLVVMGTHGRSGIKRYMLGSVAERVLRGSRIPVLVARQGTGFQPIRSILCPVNDSPAARQSLRLASRLAECFHATLTVLHVHEPGRAGGSIQDLCAWVPAEERSHCTVRELTRDGEAAREIVGLAPELGCDLLVIGAQHRRFADSTVLGATSVRVLRHAACPILAVPLGPPAES